MNSSFNARRRTLAECIWFVIKKTIFTNVRKHGVIYGCNSVYLAAINAVLSTPLKDVTVEAGKPLQLTAVLNPVASALKLAWQKNNNQIDTKAKGVSASWANGRCTLKIDSCSLADAGEFSVTWKNPRFIISSAKIIIKGIQCYSEIICYLGQCSLFSLFRMQF